MVKELEERTISTTDDTDFTDKESRRFLGKQADHFNPCSDKAKTYSEWMPFWSLYYQVMQRTWRVYTCFSRLATHMDDVNTHRKLMPEEFL